MEMLLCCLKGTDNFVKPFISRLMPDVVVKTVYPDNNSDLIEPLRNHDVIWIEWGNDLAIQLTTTLRGYLVGKRVILRIHSYEVMTELIKSIDFSYITDLIFVSDYTKVIALKMVPQIVGYVDRIHVIPNGVDMQKFSMPSAPPDNHNIAFIGYINFKKGPDVLMHAFEQIYRNDNRFRLHIAGDFQENFHMFAMSNFVQINGLNDAVYAYGFINNIESWAQDKSYIICTSVTESHPLGIMESVSMGLRPLIYNFPAASYVFPKKWTWNNFTELHSLLLEPYDREEGRKFIEDHYSLDLQVERLKDMLTSEKRIVYSPWLK